MAGPLSGRNALVLGIERPAGRRAAVALAEAGANVAVVTLSEDTKAEFAANSAANEFWAIGVRGIALTSDGREATVKEAVTDATAELGPISILVWHAPHPLPPEALAGLRSDPAIIVLIAADATPEESRALLEWTRALSARGLRANAVVMSHHAAASLGAILPRHQPAGVTDVASATVYLASDASAAIEGSAIVLES